MDKIFLAIKNFETSRTFNSLLNSYYEVDTYSNEVDALNGLQNNQYTCIIIDYSESTLDGAVLLDYLTSTKLLHNQPVCIIIDPPNIQKEIDLFNLGCAEIFNKPIDPIVTRKRIQNVITIWNLQKHVNEYEQKLVTDPLTGLLNKDGFQSSVRQELKTKNPGALLMVDLDNLKFINDNYSHPIADRIIQDFGNVLKETMPQESILAHMSGDEFCMYMKNTNNHDDIAKNCEKVLKNTERKVLLPDLARPVTASIGIALYPDSSEAYESLLSKADHALLYVKNHGKRNYKFHAQRDDREEQLKGRNECTNVPPSLMLKKREGEDIQTWLKFGEFRIVYITYQKYSPDSLIVNLCQLNILDKRNPDNPDCKKVSSLNDKISAFIKEAEYPGIFSWYSINQLLILSTNEKTLPKGIDHLKAELANEMKALQLDIELINSKGKVIND